MFPLRLLFLWVVCRPATATLLGLCTSESVILSAPQTLAVGGTVVSHAHPTLLRLHPRSSTLLAIEGDPADCDELVCAIREVNGLHRVQFNSDMPIYSLVTFSARKIHDALRKRPLNCRLMIGGMESSSPVLYWIDDTGAVQKVRYGSHGREMALVLSVMDQLSREQASTSITHDAGMHIVKNCWLGVKRRSSVYLQSLAIATSSASKTILEELNISEPQ